MGVEKNAKTVIMYSAAISACQKGQQLELAFGLLAEMAVAKVHKHSITCHAAIKSCQKRQRWQLALAAWSCSERCQSLRTGICVQFRWKGKLLTVVRMCCVVHPVFEAALMLARRGSSGHCP